MRMHLLAILAVLRYLPVSVHVWTTQPSLIYPRAKAIAEARGVQVSVHNLLNSTGIESPLVRAFHRVEGYDAMVHCYNWSGPEAMSRLSATLLGIEALSL